MGRASALLATLAALACGGSAPSAAPTPAQKKAAAEPVIVLADGQYWTLEAAGSPPRDTTVTIVPGAPRTIVIRHEAPDNATFAEVTFPAAAFADSGGGGTPVEVKLVPRPGYYALDVTLSRPPTTPGTIAFMYARYFSAPEPARAARGSDVGFERTLVIGRVDSAGTVTALSSTRPAADHLTAPLARAGHYLVLGPK